jgi:hypothetical protein
MTTNNLFGIKNPLPKRWLGSENENPQGTALFISPEYSARAYFINAEHQLLATPKNLLQFISDYAPADDSIGSLPGNPPNDPAEYAHYVLLHSHIPASWLTATVALGGLPVSYTLPLPSEDPAMWLSIALAASYYETGKPPSATVIVLGLYDFLTIPS